MSRLVARAENWEKVYEAFHNVNFAAFDYNTIKQSLLDYIKLYFPETFNDYIESSEFIALIESFAYVAELIAYRLDIDAHENFITVAQRKDSILRLAKLVSYSADRPLPARGLVKLTSVKTTENLIDANGINLSNRTIRWNDVTNLNWKDQFILVMDRILTQEFGTVKSSDRFQIENVLFELYALNISPLTSGAMPYNATVNNKSLNMELVPVEYNSTDGIIERRPYNGANFTLLYGRDGLGDSSDTTGFFCFTKQGTLRRFRKEFDGVTPNQTYEIPMNNANETDVWVNNVDPITGKILDIPHLLPQKRDIQTGYTGEWVQVDLAHAQNVIFNTNPRRAKYEVETRDNSRARIIFGDGEFADIPSGTFDFWLRESVDEDIIISQSSVVDKTISMTYVDQYNRTQTFSFTFSLINSLQNNSSAETLEHIRTTAPAVYYSQDRMVNGQDYNNFMLQDSSILKLRSLNRTFAGDSKYITWHDPSTTYENVKLVGNDGALYFYEKTEGQVTSVVPDINSLITSFIEPLLSSTDIFLYVSSFGVPISKFRRSFNTTEYERLSINLTPPPSPTTIKMYYNLVTFDWFVLRTSDDPSTNLDMLAAGWPQSFIGTPLITVSQQQTEQKYVVNRQAKRLIFQSPTTTFWNTNNASSVIDYNTLASNFDKICILQANSNYNRDSILKRNWNFNVLGVESIETGINVGLTDINRLSVIPVDENGDGVPDHMDINDSSSPLGLADIMKPKITVDLVGVLNPLPSAGIRVVLPIYYVVGQSDVSVTSLSGKDVVFGVDWIEDAVDATLISNAIILKGNVLGGSLVEISVNDYVYFVRDTPYSEWTVAGSTPDNMTYYVVEQSIDRELANIGSNGLGLVKREIGRSDLNFMWFHHSPRYHLIDPAASNIIDTLIIQKGYFFALKRWLEDPLAPAPIPPTPLDLRLAYGYLLKNKMISDTVVLHPGKIKLLFGPKAILPVQSRFKVIRTSDNSMTDNQIKTIIVSTIRNFFDLTVWEFGETFYFTELATAIHASLPIEISTVVMVPVYSGSYFGDLFQIQAQEDELFYPDISVNDIDIVTEINSTIIKSGTKTICPIQQPNVSAAVTYEYADEFTQLVPAITWTVVHDLGYYPIVSVFDSAANEIVPLTVDHLSNKKISITFGALTVGTVRLV
jgi:hypothetical protein